MTWTVNGRMYISSVMDVLILDRNYYVEPTYQIRELDK